jgi:putative heme-binding domain-containing protein
LWSAALRAQVEQDDTVEDDFKAAPTPGQRLFASRCAGCHGLDGRGSDKAPSIAGSVKVQHLSDDQISSIISNGVPGTGMPAFRTLKPGQILSLTGYLRMLQGKASARSLPGNPERGRRIFAGKGECSSCHAVSGEGGFIGPDLSAYGTSLSPQAILKSLLASTRIVPAGYKPAAVTASDGTRMEGLVRNEDNFSVQLQTPDGDFHFFEKSEALKVEYLTHSLMPTDYGDRLTRDELNDLVSYLMSTASPSKSAALSKQH